MSSDIASGAQGDRKGNGRFGQQQHAEAGLALPEAPSSRSVVALLAAWERALDEDAVNQNLLESLDIPRVRDLLIATASSDERGNYVRALAGAEAMGTAPRGTAALAGRMPTPADAEWLQNLYVGHGVSPGKRLHRLEAATADRDGLEPAMASGAATVNGWSRWQLGDLAGARGTLVSELDANPTNELANLLMAVMDVQRINREGPPPCKP